MGLALGTLIADAAKQAFAKADGTEVVNAGTAKSFAKYLGRIFQQGASEGSLVERAELARRASQSLIETHLQGKSEEEAEAIKEVFYQALDEILELRDAKDKSFQLKEVRERNRAPFAQHIAQLLAADSIAYSGSTELDATDQKLFLQEAVAVAIKEASNEEGQFNQTVFDKKLNSILQANLGRLNGEVVDDVIVSLNELAIKSSAFAAIPEIDGLAELDIDTKGDASKLEVEAKYEVMQAINNLLDAKVENKTSFDLTSELAKQNLDPNQVAYLADLISDYKEAGNEVGFANLSKMLEKSLPNFAMTGIIGAAIGWLFGGNLALGAIAGAALNLWDSAEDSSSSGLDARPSPPSFKPVRRKSLAAADAAA